MNTKVDIERPRDGSPWPYFALTLGWSWLFWIPLAISGQEAMAFPWMVLLGLGGLGPAVGGIALTYLTQDAQGRRDYWRRVIDFRRISPGWWWLIFLVHPILNLLGLVTGRLLWGSWPALETPRAFLAQPLSLLPFALSTMVVGPLPEELGWRGYALDRLQARWNALASSLVLAFFWWAWHLPLFFSRGAGIGRLWPIGTLPFWINFTLGLPATTILMTWVFNNTQRSTLGAIIFHFMANFSGEFVSMPNEFQYLRTAWSVVLALVVVLWYGPKTLAGRRLSAESATKEVGGGQ